MAVVDPTSVNCAIGHQLSLADIRRPTASDGLQPFGRCPSVGGFGQLETFGSGAKRSPKQSPTGGRTMVGLPFVDEVIQ